MTKPGRCRPIISTVLLSWNRVDLLERTLDSYFATTRAKYELFIVDNGSTDGSRRLIEAMARGHREVQPILLRRNRGGRALNLGLRRAQGQFFHISANDLEFLPGWDEELLDKLAVFPEVGQISVFSPFYRVSEGEVWSDKPAERVQRGDKVVHLAEWHVPSCSVIRREVFYRGARWRALDAGALKLPNNFAFSAAVRSLGYRVAWNDRYVVRNLGHHIAEIASRPEYYMRLADAKTEFESVGLERQLEAHGYRLILDPDSGRARVEPAMRAAGIPDHATLISARWLTRIDGTDYWSRVYDDGERIHKQATLDLAAREARFLGRLSGPHFPRVFATVDHGSHSAVTMERIEGAPLTEAVDALRADSARRRTFVRSTLDLLSELQTRGIQHRDIRPGNLMVRGGGAVLLDFGWATSPDDPSPTPESLGAECRPPGGEFCDVYSLGRVLQTLVVAPDDPLQRLIDLMADPEPELRITDAGVLRELADRLLPPSPAAEVAAPRAGTARQGSRRRPTIGDRAVEQLLRQVAARNRRLRSQPLPEGRLDSLWPSEARRRWPCSYLHLTNVAGSLVRGVRSGASATGRAARSVVALARRRPRREDDHAG